MRHLIQDKLTDAQILFINTGVSGGFLTEAQADLLYEPLRPISTVTTTNNTITTLYTYIPLAGATLVNVYVKGFETATGDALISKGFAGFKSIAGVVTQVSTQSLDRKSNFPAAVTVTIDTDGTNIRVRVTGRTGSTIAWTGIIEIV